MTKAAAKPQAGGRKSSRKGSQAMRSRAERAREAAAGRKTADKPPPRSTRVPAPVPPHQGCNGKIITSINFGRPTKCEPQIIEELCECIAEGMNYSASCDAILLPYSTFKEWSRRARVEIQRIEDERRRIMEAAPKGILSPEEIEVEPLESERIFIYFLASVKKAEAKFRRDNLKNIRKAGNGQSWQASAWLLERRLREEFGRPTADREPPAPPAGSQGNRPLDTGARIFEYYVNAPATEMPDFNEPEDLNPAKEDED